MKIALISDIHDHSDHLSWALESIHANSEVTHIFTLGDYCSPFIIEQLCTTPHPVHAVWGNNDADKQTMLHIAATHPAWTFAPREFATVVIDEQSYFLTHYPELAEHAAKSGAFNAVFHGHTHTMRNDVIGTTPIINPGKLALYPNDMCSFAIFNTHDRTTSFHTKN